MNLLNKPGAIYAYLIASPQCLWWGSILFIFISMLVLNLFMPFVADDLGYIYYFGAGYPRAITNLSDLVGSQINHYNMWGGRVVVHAIVQVLLQLPPAVTGFLNTLVYILFVFLIYKHIRGNSKEHSLPLFWIISLGIWFFIPCFGDTILWTTGSANYLWGTSIVLCFLLPYRLYATRNTAITWKKYLYCLLMLLFGVIAGCTNENTVAGMLLMAAVLLFFAYKEVEILNLPLLCGVLGALVGYVIMIVAPGNFVRTSSGISFISIVKRIVFSTYDLLFTYGWLIVFILVFISLYNKYEQDKEARKITLRNVVIYFLGAVTAIYVMMLSPQFPERAWFGIATFLFITTGILIYALKNNEVVKRFVAYGIIIGLLAFSISYPMALADVLKVKKLSEERKAIANEAIKNGEKAAYFHQIRLQSRYVHDEDADTNFLLSYYYGIYIEFEEVK